MVQAQLPNTCRHARIRHVQAPIQKTFPQSFIPSLTSSTMKSFRIRERFKILRDRLYSHVIIEKALDRIDGKLLLLLDHGLDIRTLKPATGGLRLKQEACFQILRILKRIAKSESVSFWLDYGTLLGSIRHGGFIPWDDDIDVSMVNPEYDRFCSLLPGKLPSQLEFKRGGTCSTGDVGISRVYEKRTGFHVDIFPYERIPRALKGNRADTEWKKEYEKEFEHVFRLCLDRGLTTGVKQRIVDWLSTHKQGDGTETGIATSMFYFQASSTYRRVYQDKDVFPLASSVFEGEEFFVPSNFNRILSDLYGDILRFPKDAGNAANYERSAATSQEIRSVIDELNEIVRKMDNA